MKYRLYSLLIIGILSLSVFSIPSAKADFTISFNVACHTGNLNCTDIQLAIGTSTTPARAFNGDASPSVWVKGGAFATFNVTGLAPNGTAGEFEMTIDNVNPSIQPLSLHNKIADADAVFYFDITSTGGSTGFISSDPWVLPVTHTSPTNPFKFTLDYSTRLKVQNNNLISSWTGTMSVSIEHRVRLLDGITQVSGGDLSIAFSNYTITNTNRGQALQRAYVTDTTTFTTSTKDFIRLNAVFFDRIRITSFPNVTLTGSDKVPRLQLETFLDEVKIENAWNKASILNMSAPACTFTDPCKAGETDLLLNFNARSRWNFDLGINIPNSSVNPDGYEGWTFISGNKTYTEACPVAACKNIFTVIRTTSNAESPPKSIEQKLRTETGGGTGSGARACGIGTTAQLTNVTGTVFRMRERLFAIQGEQLIFVLSHAFLATSGTPVQTCDFNVQLRVRLIDPDGTQLAESIISDTHYIGLNNVNSKQSAFQLEITQPSSLSNIFSFLDVEVNVRLYNFTQSGDPACTGEVCNVNYRIYTDTYASNWMPFVDNTGNDCDSGEECTPRPPPTCWQINLPQNCVPPPQPTFCDLNPTHTSCIGYRPSGGTPTTTPTSPSIGSVPVLCKSGSIDWKAIDINNNETAVIDATTFMTNLWAFIGCAPNFTIPLATLLMGIAMLVVPMGEKALIPVMIFFIAWGLMFSLFGFFPFWIAVVIAIGAVAGLVFGIKRSMGSE